MRLRNYSAVLSTTPATVCTAPNGYHLSIVGGFIIESDGSAGHCDIEIYDSSDNLKTTIPFPLTGTANTNVSIDSKIFLDQDEYIKAVLDTGTGGITVFGAETVKDSENIPDAWTWLGQWDHVINYVPNNLVYNSGSCYICLNPNVNDAPPSANWTTFSGGISHVERTSGDGSPGTTDTYTIYQDPGTANPISTFEVYNGADGLGGDMEKATYDPQTIEADSFDRANHTGTQGASTISDFASAVQAESINSVSEDTAPVLGGDLDGADHVQFDTRLNLQVLGGISTSVDLACSDYNEFSMTVEADITLNLLGLKEGSVVAVHLTEAAVHTITWQANGSSAGVKWAGGAEPDWPSDGTSVAIFIGYSDNFCYAGLSIGGAI